MVYWRLLGEGEAAPQPGPQRRQRAFGRGTPPRRGSIRTNSQRSPRDIPHLIKYVLSIIYISLYTTKNIYHVYLSYSIHMKMCICVI